MQSYDDVPDWLLEESPDNAFMDELFKGIVAVIRSHSRTASPLLGMAVDIQPRPSLIEMSLLFDDQVSSRSDLKSWDQYHCTASSDLSAIWQPVREAFKTERYHWKCLDGVHPKGGALFIYTILVEFVFNLQQGPVANALDAIASAPDLEVYAFNYEDPTLPNVFEVEHSRTTLLKPQEEPQQPASTETAATDERWEDPGQLRLF